MQLTGLGKSLPLICQQQSRLNYKRRVYSAHTEGALECPAWVIGEAVPLDHTGHLLHEATLLRQESKHLCVIHRNKHREAAKMRRKRNMAQMKGQLKTPEKDLNEMNISNLSDAEFKTLVIRMLKEISEDLNSIKKTQSDMKDTLIEIKNNLQGNNNRVVEAEN